MEPNKLEKEFKKQLDQRELQPSPAAWDRLDAMLTVAESPRVKPIYNWIYIAASIIGFVAIAYVFLSNPAKLEDVKRNEVVLESEKSVLVNDSLINQEESFTPQENKRGFAVDEASTKIANKSTIQVEKVKDEAIKNNNQIADNNNVPQGNKNPKSAENRQSDQKLDQVHQNLPIQNTVEPQVAQVDSKNEVSKIKVDAANLLLKVDSELETTFREKAINKLNKNYKAVKESFVARNQSNK